MQVAPKSPAVAALASFFLMGLGQLVNGDVTRGLVIWLCGATILASAFLLTFIFIGFLLYPVWFVFWLWQMYDAYQGAQKWNSRHGIIS